MRLSADRATRGAFAAALSLAAIVLAAQLLVHGRITGVTEYDDGVYYAAAHALAHGVLPYSGFAFIQPPLVAVVLVPFALLGRAIGTPHAFEAARVFVALIAVANVALVGRLLARRGVLQMLVAMVTMAVYPGAVSSAQTVLLEPLLVLFCLLGLLALFDGDEVTGNARRQIAAGVCFGLASSAKIWGIIPLASVLLVIWLAGSRGPGRLAAARIVGAAAASFAVVCLPFAVSAPGGFLRQVFVVQTIRNSGGYGFVHRAADLTGLAGLAHVLERAGVPRLLVILVWLAVVALTLVAVWLMRRSLLPSTALDRTVLATAIFGVIALLTAPTYYYHYSGFLAPFVALMLARLVGGFVAAGARARFGRLAAGGVAVVLVAVLTADITVMVQSPRPPQATAAFTRVLPRHGCVLYLEPTLGVLADRYTGGEPGCPTVVDYRGHERVLVRGLAQDPADEQSPTLQRLFLSWVRRVSAIVIADSQTSWGPAVQAYVDQNFLLVDVREQGVTVYVRTGGDAK